MLYNRLGRAGLKVSELSFGSWLTFGSDYDPKSAASIMHLAVESGINFFDNAEVYANGRSETIMGQALKEFRRESLVISSKIFWGGEGPNDTGLSWKHLVEGTKNSLKRLQIEYLDLLFCHRPDPNTPIEETVRAMDYLVRSGYTFYWGTSEWPAEAIEEAYSLAAKLNCVPPTMEQPQYSMLVRSRVEVEYAPLYKKYGLGTTIWSPLASGVLTGKYNKGIPDGSRLAQQEWLKDRFLPHGIDVVKGLEPIAKDLGCSTGQLAIAWCLKNPHVSTVILGASNAQQLKENLGALNAKDQLNETLMKQIEAILKQHAPNA
ncbi:MAG: aldo/keto reductase [Oligoflexia bacterium]|nr:aldo/keto reductase [Oligoflexia bacterium]